MNAGTVIVARQNRYLRAFRKADADSPGSARTLAELGCRDSLIRRQLTRRGVLVESAPGRFYLDPDVAEAFEGRRRQIMVTVLVLFTVGLALYLWWPIGG